MMNLTITPIVTRAGLEAVLSTLGFALPPTSVIHVGIGDGSGATSVWLAWGIQHVVIVEADEILYQKAMSVIAHKDIKPNNLYAVLGTVAASAVGVPFYRASHPRESGLINPDALRGYWPSLRVSSHQTMVARTLDEIWMSSTQAKQLESEQFHETNQGSPNPNLLDEKSDSSWLIVDCLPGKIILEGAQTLLTQASVICVRALREVLKSSAMSVKDSSLQTLDAYLFNLGFRRVAFITDSHPDIGHGVYCRDNQSSVKQALNLNQQVQDLLTNLDASIRAREALEELATELEAQLKATVEQHVKAAAENEQTQALLQTQLIDIQKQNEGHALAEDDELQLFAETQKLLETTQMSLADAKKVVTEAEKSLEATSSLLKEKETALEAEHSRVQALEAENRELTFRQQLMNEELVKAEGQIRLIKDLLLREQNL